MRPTDFLKTFTTLITFYAGAALSIPTPWSESLLEDINNLRASGLSEEEIGLRFPRALFYPDPSSPPKITLYSPPDLRSYTHHSPATLSPNTRNSNHDHLGFMTRLAHRLGLGFFFSYTCSDNDNKDNGKPAYTTTKKGDDTATATSISIKDAYDEKFLWDLINDEEDRRHGGTTTFKEGVGRRGGEMGRKEEEQQEV